MGSRQLRVQSQRFLVLLQRAARVAEALQRRPKLQPQDSGLWLRFDSQAKLLNRFRPILVGGGVYRTIPCGGKR